MISGKSFINGEFKSTGEIHFQTINPRTNTLNDWDFIEASSDDINEAVNLADKAFKEYRKRPLSERISFLHTIAEEILTLGDELIQVYCLESGLSSERATAERDRTVLQLRTYADVLKGESWIRTSVDEADPSRLPKPKPDLRKTEIPLGPVVVFGASNFPLAYSTAGGDTASALAAGCPVIVKSHPMHAGTGELVAQAIAKAIEKTAMPLGVFANLNSKGIEVGTSLVMHDKVKAVGFTGSVRGGRGSSSGSCSRRGPC